MTCSRAPVPSCLSCQPAGPPAKLTKPDTTQLNDCFLHDKDRLTHREALEILRTRITPVVAVERVPLNDLAGRICAQSVTAAHPVPAHKNSAVDGYAFHTGAAEITKNTELEVVGRAAAGHPYDGIVQPGTATRIFTGAVVPDGADTVAMQEDVGLVERDKKAFARIPSGLKTGANIRAAGEDVATGQTLFEAGHVLRPQDLAALASIGLGALDVFTKLRVAIVSTGDEIIPAGERKITSGEVYDANAPMLSALAANAGCHVSNLGVLPDDAAVIRTNLAQAAKEFDVILTSGGASRGDEDHVLATLNELGTCHMWQLAIKPGRPLMFGQIGTTMMIGLPGNPVAVFVCFLMYVYPLLLRLSGTQWPEPDTVQLPAAFAVPKRKTGRREFWRAFTVSSPTGLAVDKFARDGSGLISGLCAANGLIDVPEDVERITEGDQVTFIPFAQFGIR